MINNYDKLTDRDKQVIREYLLCNIGWKDSFNERGYFWSKPCDFYRQLRQHGSILYNLVRQSYFVISPTEYKEAVNRVKLMGIQ